MDNVAFCETINQLRHFRSTLSVTWGNYGPCTVDLQFMIYFRNPYAKLYLLPDRRWDNEINLK